VVTWDQAGDPSLGSVKIVKYRRGQAGNFPVTTEGIDAREWLIVVASE